MEQDRVAFAGYMAQLAGGRRLKKATGSGFFPDEHPVHQFVSVMIDTPELFGRQYFGHRLFMLNSAAGEFHRVIYPEGLTQMHRAEFDEQRRKDSLEEAGDFGKFTQVIMDRAFFVRVWERAEKSLKGKPWLWSANPASVVNYVTQELEDEYA